MKTTTISTNKHEIMLVELPKNTFLTCDEFHFGYKPIDGKTFTIICDLKWKIRGRIPDLTEEACEPYIEKVMQGQHFQNYKIRQNNNLPDWSSFIWCRTALESFMSLLETKIYWENPIEYPKQGSYEAVMVTNWEGLDKRWNEAQSRTFDKERTLVFVKNK